MKPDCYECKWRHDLPGDCHSRCTHPALSGEVKQAGIDELGIKANYRGIKRGQFDFPWNFDPLWLEECKGWETKEAKP